MKSNTGMPQMTTPSDKSFEKYRVLFDKDDKKIFIPVAISIAAVLITFLFLNLVAVGFGYQTAISESPVNKTCTEPYSGVRRYILPGYLAGCWFGNE